MSTTPGATDQSTSNDILVTYKRITSSGVNGGGFTYCDTATEWAIIAEGESIALTEEQVKNLLRVLTHAMQSAGVIT